MYIYIYVYVYTYINPHRFIHTYVNIYAYTCFYAYIYTHTHTYNSARATHSSATALNTWVCSCYKVLCMLLRNIVFIFSHPTRTHSQRWRSGR